MLGHSSSNVLRLLKPRLEGFGIRSTRTLASRRGRYAVELGSRPVPGMLQNLSMYPFST